MLILALPQQTHLVGRPSTRRGPDCGEWKMPRRSLPAELISRSRPCRSTVDRPTLTELHGSGGVSRHRHLQPGISALVLPATSTCAGCGLFFDAFTLRHHTSSRQEDPRDVIEALTPDLGCSNSETSLHSYRGETHRRSTDSFRRD